MTGPTLDQFVELYGRWARAVAERDRAALDALFASDYRYTSPEGDRLTREEILEVEMKVPPPGLPIRDLTVQLINETVAVVRGRHSLKGELPAGLVTPEVAARVARGVDIAFTSVWRSDRSGWHVASNDAHVVPLD
jgi:hypothetical protein